MLESAETLTVRKKLVKIIISVSEPKERIYCRTKLDEMLNERQTVAMNSN